MKKIVVLMLWAAFAAHAQLDRAGNVIEADSSDFSSGWSVPVFVFIGALAGLLVNAAKPNLSLGFCVAVGCIAGAVVQAVV